MRRQATILLNTVFALVLMGILMVFSTRMVAVLSAESPDLFQHHLLYVGVGVTAMIVAARFDYRELRAPLIYRSLMIAAFLLLILVLIPGIGIERGGARRWIGLAGFTFQPSEFAKLALIIYLAVKLCENQEHIKSFGRGFLPPMAVAGVFALLIVCEPDLGTPVVICASAFLMLMMAGARWSHILGGLVPAGVAAAWLIISSPYRFDRLKALGDPWKYRDEGGYHLIQSMAAFVRGGLLGRGSGAGEQKLFYLPQAQSDFIYAVWGEEMGLVGAVLMVLLFVIFLIVSLRIAVCARDLFGGLLAAGSSASIALQAAINMAVTIGLFPTKGLPLPFISAGGSALVVNLLLVGLLLSVARQAADPERKGAVGPAR